jgi:hypothetical protein
VLRYGRAMQALAAGRNARLVKHRSSYRATWLPQWRAKVWSKTVSAALCRRKTGCGKDAIFL